MFEITFISSVAATRGIEPIAHCIVETLFRELLDHIPFLGGDGLGVLGAPILVRGLALGGPLALGLALLATEACSDTQSATGLASTFGLAFPLATSFLGSTLFVLEGM